MRAGLRLWPVTLSSSQGSLLSQGSVLSLINIPKLLGQNLCYYSSANELQHCIVSRLKTFRKAGICSRRSVANLCNSGPGFLQEVLCRSYSNNIPWKLRDSVPDLQRFLSEIGTDPKEARFWLKQFLNINQKKPFAVVEVDSELFADSLQAAESKAKKRLEHLASAISFLQRNSLRPILICGDKLQSSNGDHKSLQELKQATSAKTCALNDALNEQGFGSCILFAGSNVIEVEHSHSTNKVRVKHINPELIQWCMSRQTIPIIPAFGETAEGQIAHLKLWDVTSAVTRQLQPLKVIKVNSHGGFQDDTGQIIANVNLPFDLQTVNGKPWCTKEVVETIMEVSSLLSHMPQQTSVVITAADKVLQELFTHHGSGTFLKTTEAILKYHNLGEVDVEKLRTFISMSFNKTLSKSYFENVQKLIHTIYLSENYTTAAVILRIPGCAVPYLCKFAVSPQAQGEGTGEILWEVIRSDFRQLFWRSRGTNPINPWYFRKSEGSWSNGHWTVFWYGISEPPLSTALINKAISVPESFISPNPCEKQPKSAKSG